MTIPTRVMQAIRPEASSGVMAGAAVVAATFAATPFLLPEISTSLSMDIGRTGLYSTAQVGSFALASFLAGRMFRPRRRLHYGSLLLVALATALSAFVPTFPLILATRVVAGLGLGTITWIAWADATRFERGVGDVAAVAPVTAAIASPILAWLVEQGGHRLVFLALAVVAAAATLFPVGFGDLPRIGRNVSRSRSNRVLLAALGIVSLGGSSVFIFSGATAQAVQGMTPVAVSWALSINAVAGVLATRHVARSRTAAIWLLGCVVPALIVGTIASPWLFFAVMILWGYSFWMAVPAILKLLAERSINPSERMGDAQAAMASGRVFGPILGGIALGAGQFTRLSVVGAAIMASAAITVAVVEWHRSTGGANLPGRGG